MTPQSIKLSGKNELFEQQTGTNNISNKLEMNHSPLIKPNKILMENIDERISKLSYTNTSNIKLAFDFNKDDMQHNFNPFLQNSDKIIEPKRSYYRDIKINTEGLERTYPNNLSSKNEKQKKSTYKSPSDILSQNNLATPDSALPTAKVQQRSFKFSEKLFDHRSPTSQDRSYWFCQFLMKKLGDEKFEKVKNLLENCTNPMQIINEQKQVLIELMGEENQDFVRILKCLISSAVTPTSDSKQSINNPSYSTENKIDDINKAFSFDKIIKSPLNANYPSSMGNLSSGTTTNENNLEEIKENKINSTRKTPERHIIVKDNLRSPIMIPMKSSDHEIKIQEYTNYFHAKSNSLPLSTKKN